MSEQLIDLEKKAEKVTSFKEAVNAICPFVLGSHAGGQGSNDYSLGNGTCILPLNGITTVNYRISGYSHQTCTYTIKTLNASGTAIATKTHTLCRSSSYADYSISAEGAVKFTVAASFAKGSGSFAWNVTIRSLV